MGRGTAHLLPPGSNILETSPNPVSQQPGQGFWLLTGLCLESSGQVFLGARDPLFRPRDWCLGNAMRDPLLYITQMKARAITVVPLYTTLSVRPL